MYTSAYIAILIGYSVKVRLSDQYSLCVTIRIRNDHVLIKVQTVMVIILYAYMWSVNKKRDREAAQSAALSDIEEREAIERGMQDVTELDNKGFRYVL